MVTLVQDLDMDPGLGMESMRKVVRVRREVKEAQEEVMQQEVQGKVFLITNSRGKIWELI